jgi:hypothetical protein
MRLRVLNILRPFALFFFLSGTAFADCAVLSPEQAEYYYRQDLKNVLFKVAILIPTILLALAGAWTLARLKFGWIGIILIGLTTAPIFLAVYVAEVWSMECGIAGIGAHYYLVFLLSAIAMFVLANRYARSHAASS